MDTNRVAVVLSLHKKRKQIDLDVPLDITAQELIIALNSAFQLGLAIDSPTANYHLKTENPIALLHGNKLLSDYGLRNGTIIHFTQ